MSARTTIERASTDLLWCHKQLRNPDEVTAHNFNQVRMTVRDTLDALFDLTLDDLPAEQAAAAEVKR